MENSALEDVWKILSENVIETDVEPSSELICIICKKILIKPFLNVLCACKYCYHCLLKYLNGQSKLCFGETRHCKSELINFDENVFFDPVTSDRILRLVAKCPFRTCEFKTKLGEMIDHLRTCEKQPVTCPYQHIGCQTIKINNDKIKEHFEQENYVHGKLLMEHLENWRNELTLLNRRFIEVEQNCNDLKLELRQRPILALGNDVEQLFQESRTIKEDLENVKLDNMEKQRIAQEQKEEMELLTEAWKQRFHERCDKMEKSQEQLETKREDVTKSIENILIAFQTNPSDSVRCIITWTIKKIMALMGIVQFGLPPLVSFVLDILGILFRYIVVLIICAVIIGIVKVII